MTKASESFESMGGKRQLFPTHHVPEPLQSCGPELKNLLPSKAEAQELQWYSDAQLVILSFVALGLYEILACLGG